MAIYLGIDIGTSSVKTIAMDETGAVVASATDAYPLSQPRPGYAEQEPTHWWDGTVKTVREVLESTGTRYGPVAGIGLSGQMHSLVLLDDAGQSLRPSILWCDQRTEAQCREITELLGFDRLRRYTGNRALTGFTAPKLLWVRKHEPDIYRRIRHALLPKDYIRFRLTGEFATEVSDASGTLLLDVGQREWSTQMLDVLQIPRAWLPTVYESSVVSGRVSAACAALTGLPEGTPVVGGGGDQAAGAVGTGVVRSGDVSVALGTSGVVFAYQDAYEVDDQCRLHTFCHAVPGSWHTMGVMLSATGSLDWWRVAVGQTESDEARRTGGNPYELLCQPAANVAPGSDGLLFLPYLMGERTPHPDPLARGAFIGLTSVHEKRHMTRALMEGVVFGLRDSLELMNNLGTQIDQLRVTGGGGKSAIWRQILADITGKTVVTVNANEGPAYGVALLAAVGTGAFTSVQAACGANIRKTSETHPSANRSAYEDYYQLYRGMYNKLKDSFAKLSTLAAGE